MRKSALCKIVIFLIIVVLPVSVLANGSFYVINNENLEINVSDGNEGMISAVDKNSQRYGFIDRYGDIKVPSIYKEVGKFNDGFCPVTTVDNEFFLIDRNGNQVFELYDKNVIYKKHGKFGAVIYTRGYGKGTVFLVDENFNMLANGKILKLITKDTYTFFADTDNGRIYNYKGEDITSKMEGFVFSSLEYLFASDKYILVGIENEDEPLMKLFDVNGSPVSEIHASSSDIYLTDNFVVLAPPWSDFVVYNTSGKELYRKEGGRLDYQLFDNCIRITKDKGTSALIDSEGNAIIDFGKWDMIYPTANDNVFVVGNGNKYGLADKNGNLIKPLEYNSNGLFYTDMLKDNGKYVCLKDNKNNYITFNVFTLEQFAGTITAAEGGKYILHDYNVMDENFTYITSARPYDFGLRDGIFVDNQKPLKAKVFSDNGGIKVKKDGKYLTFDQLPITVNDRTMVPLRKIFESIGAKVYWNETDQSITAIKGGKTIKMQIGNNTMTVNEKNITLDVSPQIVGSRTLVPVRAIAESFDMTVDWDGYTNTVNIFSN